MSAATLTECSQRKPLDLVRNIDQNFCEESILVHNMIQYTNDFNHKFRFGVPDPEGNVKKTRSRNFFL